jgi:hypothetical protein
MTTITGGMAAARAIAAARHGVVPEVRSLQEIHRANAEREAIAGGERRRDRSVAS